MPITYTTPQVVNTTVNGALIRSLVIDAETGTVTFNFAELDVGGNPISPPPQSSVGMTTAAFLSAMQTASGSFKSRIYQVFQTALGVTGTVT